MRSAIDISMLSLTMYARGWNCCGARQTSSKIRGFDSKTHHVDERIRQAHHGDDQHVHAEREADDIHVEFNERSVFREAVHNKIDLDDVDEVEVEARVNDEVDA